MTPPPPPDARDGLPRTRRYAAFISYRHADNREPGRRWADWLHQALETYDVPRDLVGTPSALGAPVPATLYPVFRDEEELAAEADLSQNLRRALEDSDALVVICSPRACQSAFVEAEIRAFKELGRSQRILALVVDGEPNVDDPARRGEGFDPALECLPRALRMGVPDADGRIDWDRRAEPIAADARPEGRPVQGFTSAAAYGEALRRAGGRTRAEIHRLQRDYAARLELTRLKLIAGVLAVALGPLRRRDAAHRARRLRRLAAAFGGLALLALLAAIVAVWQGRRATESYERAEEARRRQRVQLVEASRHAHAAAERELAEGRWRQGVALLGQALRYDPESATSAARLWSALAYGRGDRDEPPLAAWTLGAPVEALAVSRDERALAAITSDGRLHVLDLATGRRRDAALSSSAFPRRLRFSPEGGRLLFGVGVLECHLAAWDDATPGITLTRLEGDYHDAAFAPQEGEIVAAGVLQDVVRFAAADGRRLAASERGPVPTTAAVFDPDGRFLLRRRSDATCTLLDLAQGAARPVAGVPQDELLHAALLGPGGAALAVPSGATGPYLLDVHAGRSAFTASPGVTRWSGVDVAPDGSACALEGPAGTLELRGVSDGSLLGPALRPPTSPWRVAFAPDGRRVFVGDAAGCVSVWPRPVAPAAAGVPLAEGASTCAWLDATRAAVLRADGVELWDVAARRLTQRLETGPAAGGMAVASDGSWIAIGGAGGKVRLYAAGAAPATTPRDIPTLPGAEIYQVLAGPLPDRFLVSAYDLSQGGLAQRLCAVDAIRGVPLGPEVRLERLALRLGLSPDGARFVAAFGPDGPWRAWDVASGAALAEVGAQDRRAIEERDRRPGVGELASVAAGADAAQRAIVDTTTRLARSEPLGGAGVTLSWSPDGRALLRLESGGALRVLATPSPGRPGPWLDDLVAAAAGMALSDSGLGRPIPAEQRAAALARLRGAEVADPAWAALVRWWLAGAERPSTGP